MLPLVGPLRDPMACCSSDRLSLRTTSARADFSSWISSSCIWTLCSREAMRSVTSILLAADALSSEEMQRADVRHGKMSLSFYINLQIKNGKVKKKKVCLWFLIAKLIYIYFYFIFFDTGLEFFLCIFSPKIVFFFQLGGSEESESDRRFTEGKWERQRKAKTGIQTATTQAHLNPFIHSDSLSARLCLWSLRPVRLKEPAASLVNPSFMSLFLIFVCLSVLWV